MADEAAHIRALTKFVSSRAGNPHYADLLATAQRPGANCEPTYSTDTENSDSNEYPVGQCAERCEWGERPDHHQGDSERRTRSASAGCISGCCGCSSLPAPQSTPRSPHHLCSPARARTYRPFRHRGRFFQVPLRSGTKSHPPCLQSAPAGSQGRPGHPYKIHKHDGI